MAGTDEGPGEAPLFQEGIAVTPFEILLGSAWSAALFGLGLYLGVRARRPLPALMPDVPVADSYMSGFRDGVKVGVSRGLRMATAQVGSILGKVITAADDAERAVCKNRQRFTPDGQDVRR
jgi:hypothetical protein